MKAKYIVCAVTLLFALVACGPADVQTGANDALATASALVPADAEQTVVAALDDPTIVAAASEVAAVLEDPQLESTLNDAFNTLNDQVTLTQGENLGLDALAGLADITNYTMTVTEAPASSGVAAGTVIKEASNGNISLTPEEYGKYFTVAGDYKIRLDVTNSSNSAASHEFTVTVP